MGQASSGGDLLARLDPRRREALEKLWASFADAGVSERSLSDEVIRHRRQEAAAEDKPDASMIVLDASALLAVLNQESRPSPGVCGPGCCCLLLAKATSAFSWRRGRSTRGRGSGLASRVGAARGQPMRLAATSTLPALAGMRSRRQPDSDPG